MTLKNQDDLCKALHALHDQDELQDRTTGSRADYVMRLWRAYWQAQHTALKFGFVGVGCITFAENRLVEYQRRVAVVMMRNHSTRIKLSSWGHGGQVS